MARSKITSSGKDLLSDDGAVLFSIIRGEQIRIAVSIGWMTNLQSCTITIKAVEALNLGDGEKPEAVRVGGITTIIPIIDTIVTDNLFDIVIPETLASDWTVKPSPDKPAYAFIDMEIADAGVGVNKQVFKPLSGLIEVNYSPTEG